MVGKATPDRGGPRKSPDGVDPKTSGWASKRTRKIQRDGHNSGVKIWSLCSVSSILSHATLQHPFRTLAIKWEVNIFLKKSSCVLHSCVFLPTSFILASVIIASVCIQNIYVCNKKAKIQHNRCIPQLQQNRHDLVLITHKDRYADIDKHQPIKIIKSDLNRFIEGRVTTESRLVHGHFQQLLGPPWHFL